MKKFFLYIFGFVILCFIIPIIFTKRPETNQTSIIPNEENLVVEENTPYKYTNYGTVKLLHKETGEIEELSMEQYLYRCSISRNASNL